MCMELDQALLLQLPERFAEGAAADAEFRGEWYFQEACARHDLPGEDARSQCLQDLVSQDPPLRGGRR